MSDASARLDLYSMKRLEVVLGRPRAELRDLGKHAVRYYDPFPLPQKKRPFARRTEPAKKRWIDHPIDPLKAIQSRIQERLLARLTLPEHLLGGVSGRCIRDNARLHMGARHLVTIDIKNFYPSITPAQVFSVFRKTLNCSREVAYLLTSLTTCRERLPQGAPTSPILANLVLSSFDAQIRFACVEAQVLYSSWVDDLAFSGESVGNVVGIAITTLTKAGFRVAHNKIKRMAPGDRKELNKLVLGRFITVRKEYRTGIRAGIHNLLCGKVRDGELEGYIEGLKGKINYLGLFDNRKAIAASKRLQHALRTLSDKTLAC